MARPDPTARTDRVTELMDSLVTGVEALTSSDDWLRWLDVARRFHRYSFWNTVAILTQAPRATQVAGYQRWKTLGRQVRRGERAIRILAPCARRRTVVDDATGEETTVTRVAGWKVASVFDISQTDGPPLPEIPISRLDGPPQPSPHRTRRPGASHQADLPHRLRGLRALGPHHLRRLPHPRLSHHRRPLLPHIDTEIRPALTAGKTVICDRYITSLALDQLRGAPPDLLWSLHTPLPQPDLCIVLTGDTATITQRLTARGYHSRWQPGATSQELTLYTDVATQLLDRGWPVRFIDCTSTTPEDTATSITETLQAT